MASNSATVRVNKCAASPNMLISTTYALNKSNTKRAAVGLECDGGFYKPVVKLCGSGQSAKNVTLDVHTWELVVDQMDAMRAYLNHAYTFYQEFGQPTKTVLPYHDIHYTTAYGSRAIGIFDKSNDAPVEQESQSMEEPKESFAVPCKKFKKSDNSPGIVMQHTTLQGLRDVRECISERLVHLEKYAVLVNRCVDFILEYLKDALKSEGMEKSKCILKDIDVFKQFYTLHRSEINNKIKTTFEVTDVDVLDIILLELYAFSLFSFTKDLHDMIFPE